MEFAYRNRKHIARITLVPLVCTLLLALNFKIWSETYSEGNPETTIVNQLEELDYFIPSNIDNLENVKGTVQIKQLSDTGFIGIIIDYLLLSFLLFISIYRSKLFCERGHTLVSLCVRKDE